MKQYLKGDCAAGEYRTTQDETTDADGPHHAFNRFADFPADHASAAADNILQRLHWIIHKSLRLKISRIIDDSCALSMTLTSHSRLPRVPARTIHSSALSPRPTRPDFLCVFGCIEIRGFLHGSNWRGGGIPHG